MKNNKFHIFLLFLCSFLWGTTFVAQSIGAEHVGAFTYLAGRSWVAVAFLTPVVHVMDRFFDRRGIDNRRPRNASQRKYLITAGCISGVLLCAASAAQQIGIAYTTASKAGFITALYVVIVPLLSIFLNRRPTRQIWFCVLLALVGMYLLCMTGVAFSPGRGDALMLLCAFLFSIQIMLVNHFSGRVDGLRLSFLEMLTEAVLATVFMLVFEHPTREGIMAALPALLYAGIMSSGVAYTFQILGQKGTDPAVASLIMSLESVFSAIGGWLILHQKLSVREAMGCALMFMAIVIAQLPDRSQ